MGSVAFPLKLSACILIFLILEIFCVTCDEDWCYDKPSCGPSTWRCFGNKQSPINIDTKTVLSDPSLRSLHFSDYEDLTIADKLMNSGHHLQILFRVKATIRLANLLAIYYLHQGHFHWGTQNSNGAEHTIDGIRYAMEMHLVHTKNNMSIEEASKESDGLLVLAFLITVSSVNGWPRGDWFKINIFIKDLEEGIDRELITFAGNTKLAGITSTLEGNSVDLNGKFSLGSLLKTTNVDEYFLYKGSLTTPPCAEAVIWIVFEEPLEISSQMHEKFTTALFFTTIQENRPMQNNFRPLQPLNDREVFYYTERKSVRACINLCIARLF